MCQYNHQLINNICHGYNIIVTIIYEPTTLPTLKRTLKQLEVDINIMFI